MRKSLLLFVPLFIFSISCKESEKEITGPKKTITILKNRVGYLIGDVVNVRSKPTIKSKVMGTVKYGDWVTLTTKIQTTDKKYKTWYKIIYKNNHTGYIYSKLAVKTDKKIKDYPFFSKMRIDDKKVPTAVERVLNISTIIDSYHSANIDLYKGRIRIYLRKTFTGSLLDTYLKWFKKDALEGGGYKQAFDDYLKFDKLEYKKMSVKLIHDKLYYTIIANGSHQYGEPYSSFNAHFFKHHKITNYSFKNFSSKIKDFITDLKKRFTTTLKLDFTQKIVLELTKIKGKYFTSKMNYDFVSSKATITYRTNTE